MLSCSEVTAKLISAFFFRICKCWFSYDAAHFILHILQGAFSRLDPTGQFAEKLLDILPVGRLGEVPEIANLVSYMVSDYSSWMSGEVCNIIFIPPAFMPMGI